jgi:uncharacterized membrane protein YhaH (DUF805 family)
VKFYFIYFLHYERALIVNNPYQASQSTTEADLDTAETYHPKFLSLHGRIGRVRYLAYLIGAQFILGCILSGLSAIILFYLQNNIHIVEFVNIIVGIFSYVVIVSAGVVLTKRRFNDMDYSGWLGLLFIIPFINIIIGLMLICKRGSEYKNQYGKPPAPNTIQIWLVALLPLFLTMGIILAVALPAYQKYSARAKQAQQGQQEQQIRIAPLQAPLQSGNRQ